ncbi:PilT/PilU family type 4a pilus ATPase [Pseudomonadota bacterium]
MKIESLLKLMVQQEASDLYLTTGAPPCAKVHGSLKLMDRTVLVPGEVKKIGYALMDEEQTAKFEHKPEMNLAISETGLGHFRVNIFKQRNKVAMVVRHIKSDIHSMESLGLPPILEKVIMAKRGLVLLVGATGSGKSTTLASMIDYRNSNSAGHIITIEDPVEFVHRHKRSLVNQREIGIDTDSYENALKNALRQAPDVILIGEIRDQETMEHAINFAETGHLSLSTLHANNANQALDRIINFSPEERRNQLLLDLSLNFRAVISQRLLPTVDGKRTAAVEVMLGSPRIQDLIRRGEIEEIKAVMAKSGAQGMQTFDSDIVRLHMAGKISLEEAVRNADSPSNLKLAIQNLQSGQKASKNPGQQFELIEEKMNDPELQQEVVEL